MRLQQFASRFLDEILPQTCLVCGAKNGPVCSDCNRQLPQIAPSRCPYCALPTVESGICGRCIAAPPHYDATQAIFEYRFPIDMLVKHLKYRQRFSLLAFFADRLHAVVSTGADLVIPVPMHPSRLVERGFNHSVEIARVFANRRRLPLAINAVNRIRATARLEGMSRRQRFATLRGAFTCPLPLDNKKVLVVDDVMTTGATLEALAQTLKKAGAVRVENLVIARTLPDQADPHR